MLPSSTFNLGLFQIPQETANLIGLLSGIATAIALVVAIIQLRSSNKQRKESAMRSAVKEAVGIAQLFQSTICSNISYALRTYTQIELVKFMEIVPDDCELLFTEAEALRRFGPDCISKYEEYLEKINGKVIDAVDLDSVSIILDANQTTESDAGKDKYVKIIDDRNIKCSLCQGQF